MKRASSLKWALLPLILIAHCLPPRLSRAEELLKKHNATYLGWKISSTEFRTCSSTRMQIGDGVILSTDKKCTRSPGPGAFARWHGVLVRFSEDGSVLTVRRGNIEKAIRVTADTEYTQAKGKRVVDIDKDDVREGDEIICLGKYDRNGDFVATRIGKRLPR
jgi:hypothetical protein